MANKENFVPKYLVIVENFKKKILNNSLKPGEKIPPVVELIKTLGVSQATIEHAMKILIDEGLVIRKRRVGTVVTGLEDRKLKTDIHTIYIINRSPADVKKNPWTWFIPDGLIKGIVNANPGYQLKIFSPDDDLNLIKKDQGSKAFIIIGLMKKYLSDIVGDSIFVGGGGAMEYGPVNCVSYDTVTTTFKAIAYLVDTLKHQKTAIIWRDHNKDIISGYMMAFNMYKIPYRQELVIKANGGEETGWQAAEKLLKKKGEFTAVFADTDLKAIGAIECFRKNGIRVPEDISVMGMDDIPGVAEDFGLTTMRKSFVEIGEAMIKIIDQRIKNNYADIPSIPMCGTLVERKTCQPKIQRLAKEA